MKAQRGLLICLLLAVSCAPFCMAQAGSSELQRRADQASGVDCAHLSMQAAHQLLEEANGHFVAGDVKAAHSAIETSLHYARRSVDCTIQLRKGEKSAEIDLRRLIRRMKDILQTLDSEDRPHLSRSITELEKQRDRLLHAIFGAAAGGSAPEKKKP
jgi:hypothetical protein